MVGNLATGAVLLYGGLRVMEGDIKVGVLATFLLYLQRFFDPLQDLSQFYNTFQSAAAALEKISGVLEEQPAVAEPAASAPLPDRHGAGREVRLRGGPVRLRRGGGAARARPDDTGRADGGPGG